MEKKFKFSDNPTVAKVIYAAVIAALCITAIVVGIIAANNRKKNDIIDEKPPVSDGGNQNDGNTPPDDQNQNGEQNGGENTPSEKTTYIAPVSGKVMKEHSMTVPVYSETLEAWKIHTGIDISTAEAAEVFAVAAGEVTKVYADPMLGNTVEITHEGGVMSRYSNLDSKNLPTVGTKLDCGAKIGVVGDSAISEIADETHLHFEMFENDKAVNPLDYISEDAKKASLGIDTEEAA